MPRRARYPSDLTGAAWALVAPLVPAPAKDGRTPKHRARDLIDALVSVARTGGAGRARPAEVPPGPTV